MICPRYQAPRKAILKYYRICCGAWWGLRLRAAAGLGGHKISVSNLQRIYCNSVTKMSGLNRPKKDIRLTFSKEDGVPFCWTRIQRRTLVMSGSRKRHRIFRGAAINSSISDSFIYAWRTELYTHSLRDETDKVHRNKRYGIQKNLDR